jgi:hypothetical protein
MLTMDHAHATLTGAAERYVLGEMSEQERDQYEEHFFSCATCADEVSAADRFVELARARWRVEPAPGRVVAGAGVDSPAPSRWAGFLGWFHPLPSGAAAAGLVLLGVVAYQALILVPGLRQQLREADGVQTAPSYFLSVSRGEAPVITVSGEERLVSLTLSRNVERPFPFYRFEVHDASGRTIMADTLRAPSSGDELHVLLPTRGLPSGSYVIVVGGLDSRSSRTAGSDSARYPFTLDRRDSTR